MALAGAGRFSYDEAIDLTRPINEDLPIYGEEGYQDPPFSVETWCTVSDQGYWVSELRLGTQTGTHLDAPAHFCEGGATLEALPAEWLIGPYHLVDLDDLAADETGHTLTAAFAGQRILLLVARGEPVTLSMRQLDRLCDLGARVWVLAGSVQVAGRAPLHFHRHLAEHGIFLVEDLEPDAARRVPPGGLLVALPLRLQGVSGSPCRVVVLI